MRFSVWLLAIVTIAALTASTASAQDSAGGMGQGTEERVRRLAKHLQCPICESVTVADSPAELAVQMRGVIRAKIEAGESDEQIISYFVERYGDGILAEPPRRGLSLLVWLGPVLALVIGAGGVWLLLRRRRLPSRRSARVDADQSIPDWQLAQAERELNELRR